MTPKKPASAHVCKKFMAAPGLSKFSGIPLVPGLVCSRVDKSGGIMNKSRFLLEFDLPFK